MRWQVMVCLLLCASNSAGGEVFKWRDAAGRLHYADRPPAHVDSATVPVPTCPDDACRERRERAYHEAVEQFEAMQARESRRRAGSRGRTAAPPSRPERIAAGMSRRDVVKVLGKPAIIKRRAGRVHGGELWIYRDGSGTRKVRFDREGVVVGIVD